VVFAEIFSQHPHQFSTTVQDIAMSPAERGFLIAVPVLGALLAIFVLPRHYRFDVGHRRRGGRHRRLLSSSARTRFSNPCDVPDVFHAELIVSAK
jgi:hypothetical protein